MRAARQHDTHRRTWDNYVVVVVVVGDVVGVVGVGLVVFFTFKTCSELFLGNLFRAFPCDCSCHR